MKFTCQKENLINAINIVSKAVSTRKALPILECVLIKATEDGLKILSNDLEMAIETSFIEAEIEETGTLAIEAKMFFEIIRKLSDGEVFISSLENYLVKIKSGKTEFKIMGQSGDDFPLLPEVEKEDNFKVSSKKLRDIIRKTIFAVSLDESKPAITGELFEIEDDFFNVVAVDGFRASLMQEGMNTGNTYISVIIPSKTLNEVVKILPNEDDFEVLMYFTDKHILFELSNCVVVSRLLEGQFINYKNIFTKEYTTIFTANKSELLLSLERSLLMSRDSKKSPVKFEIGTNNLVITSQTEMGKFYDEFAIEMDGEALEIGFNPKYLIDVLKAIDDEKITIQFTTSLNPCIIKGVEDSNYEYLVLPLRLR